MVVLSFPEKPTLEIHVFVQLWLTATWINLLWIKVYRLILSFHICICGEGEERWEMERSMEDNTIFDCDRDTKNPYTMDRIQGEGVFIFDNSLFLCSLCV